MVKSFLAIFIGGGLGSMMRYGVQLLMHERITPYNFPWSTLTVNVIGSFMIGLFYALSAKYNLSTDTRLLLTTGLCGGFTTFSTFSNDSLALLKQGEVTMFVIYVCLSVILGVLATLAAILLSK